MLLMMMMIVLVVVVVVLLALPTETVSPSLFPLWMHWCNTFVHLLGR